MYNWPMDRAKIRNFSIIAHIDHGKSTLADRMLELTHTVEKRKMMEQVLDSMELERERGITIKMQPVRMQYSSGGSEYVLNLIDTPGHIDFSYEVSRAMKAVEGAVLLVDATQGVQAQTLTTLAMAREIGLVIVPAVSKVDAPLARVAEVTEELAILLGVEEEDILLTSGKTGDGVLELLDAVVDRIPAPSVNENEKNLRALIFDFEYSNHQGIIVFVRFFGGTVKKTDRLRFCVANAPFVAHEIGVFRPEPVETDVLADGEIGYIVTGIKEPGIASVGDTITTEAHPAEALEGYQSPKPVVWASVYPESQDDFPLLRHSLDRLRLSDSSLSFEEEQSGVLGRGFRCGFLGMLHLEIITERLRREFSLILLVTTPSITYDIQYPGGKRETVYSPLKFPEYGIAEKIFEPWVAIQIIIPPQYIGAILSLLYDHEAAVGASETFSDNRMMVKAHMPLRELMRNFFDDIKSLTSGFASLSYEITDMKEADVVRLDVLVGNEVIPAFSRVVSRKRVQEEAEHVVEKLHDILPRQQFVMKIQGQALGRILSSRTVAAFRKDVTAKLYGGDITRKMKLLEKQKKGKKKMKSRGQVNIPHDVFLKMMRP